MQFSNECWICLFPLFSSQIPNLKKWFRFTIFIHFNNQNNLFPKLPLCRPPNYRLGLNGVVVVSSRTAYLPFLQVLCPYLGKYIQEIKLLQPSLEAAFPRFAHLASAIIGKVGKL